MKLRRLAALVGALALTLGLAGTAFADSGNPSSVNASVSGHTVTVSGNWTWTSCPDPKRIVGWAVAWGDPGWTNNALPKTGGGNYYMGDATQGNTVFTAAGHPTSAYRRHRHLGPMSHTCPKPGKCGVCVILCRRPSTGEDPLQWRPQPPRGRRSKW